MESRFQSKSSVHFREPYMRISAFSYKNYSIEPHTHDFYEMNIVLGGSGTHIIENSSFKVQTGDVFVIPPLTVHAYVDTDELEVYHILIHKKFIEENRDEAYAVRGFTQFFEIEPFLRSQGAEAMFLHLSSSNLVRFHWELRFIEDNGFCDGETMAPLKHHTVWKLIYWFSSLLCEQTNGKDTRVRSRHDKIVVNTLEYIHAHYGEKIDTDRLCERVFLSRSTFLRSFKTICGCSPMQYLNAYRCRKALELIEAGEMSKTDIAHACGFYDLSHMEKAIRGAK